MAEQLEIVIGANVDDAKAGVKDLQAVITDFARQGKLSIGVVEQSLAQLKQQIKVTTDPADAAKLKTAFTELQRTLQQLKISGGLESQLNGISRSTRLAHGDLDQMSRSLAEVASGNGNIIESLSRVAFSFEQLRGQTGSAKGALAELGAVLKSPAGILVAGAALVPLLVDLGGKFIEMANGSRQAEDDLRRLTEQLKLSQEAIKGFNQEIDQAAITRKLKIDIETPPGIGRTIAELAADLDAAQLKITNTVPAIKSYREELDRVEASSKKVANAQKDLHVGSLAFEQNKVTLANNEKQIELLKKQIKDANTELEKAQADQINIPLRIKLTELDQARSDAKKQLDDFNRALVEKAKSLVPFFQIPVDLKFQITDTSKEELKKAQDIIKGIEDHTIRLKFISLTETKGIEAELKDIQIPQLKLKIDDADIKAQIIALSKSVLIPIDVALNDQSLGETEDKIKQIFSKFSDTNIFTEAGRNAGTKFREALLQSVQIFNKGFVISPNIDVTQIIDSLTTSLSGIKDIQLKVIKTETFDNAIRTLRDLHDAGLEAGEAVEQAFLKAGKSSEEAAAAGLAITKAYGGITKQTEDVARGINDTLTPAFQNLFDAIIKGENPLKAFFQSIGQSLEQLAAKLIGSEIEKAILSLLSVTSGVTAAISATTTATVAASAAGTAAAATAGVAAAASAAAATSAAAAAAAAVIAAAAAKAAIAAINPLAFLGFLGFAEGGEPPVNKPSIVGEKGWELFVPKVPGTIYSHADSMKLVSNASVKDHESIKEYLIASHITQQLKEHFSTAFRSIETNVKILATNNEKLAAYSYKLHENIQSLKESFTSITNNNERLNNNSDKSITTHYKESFDKINNSIKESIKFITHQITPTDKPTDATIVSNTSKSYENLVEKITYLQSKSITSAIEKLTVSRETTLHEKIDRSVTIERIINNNFYSSEVSNSLKQFSIHDLIHKFNIPAFAGGGAVFGPTLAILGEGFGISRSNPEFVGTASQLKGIQGGQFDINVNVDGELSFSMGKLAIALNREVRSQLRTSGKNPF